MTYQQEREEFAIVMAREFPDLTVEDVRDKVNRILRDANRIQAHAVNACNRETTPRENTAADNASDRIGEEFAGFGHAYEIETSGDPRGACVKVKFRTHRGNSFGGDGFYCVPTRRF